TAPAAYSSTAAATIFTTSGISLSANSTYWIVLQAGSGKFDWSWTADTSGDGAGFQRTWGQSLDAGATWATYAIYPTQFQVTATAGASATCTYSLSRQTASIAASGDIFPLDVVTSSSCSWSVAGAPDWIAVTNTAVAGSARLHVDVAANFQSTPRTATITIGGVALTVTQAAAGCSFIPTVGTASLPAAGGTFALTIATTSGCAWTAAFQPGWLSSVATSGTGTATINFTAAPNTTTLPRTGTVQVGSQVLQLIEQRVDASGSGFTDVPATSLYFDQVTLLKQGAITQGCTSTAYCPDAITTRGQMAVFIIRSL